MTEGTGSSAPAAPPVVACVVLAAGGSDRMGRPKLLMKLAGRRVIQYAVEAAADSRCAPVLVVMGSDASRLSWYLTDRHMLLTTNPDWRDGISTTIQRGIEAALRSEPMLDAILFVAADQPLVTAAHLDRIVERYEQGRDPIVASRYAGKLGIPALFARSMFERLRSLSGDEGASGIIRDLEARAAAVDCPEAEYDADTPEDLERIAGLLAQR